jgi:hypothetical protein
MEFVKERVFKRPDFSVGGDGIRPDPGNLPNIDLAVGDNVGASGG